MKKAKYSALLFFGIVATTSRAQFYSGVSAGYGFGICKISASDDKYMFNGTTYTEEHESRPFSLGTGLNMNLYGGYMLNNTLGFELGGAYLLGAKQDLKSSDQSDFSFLDTYEYEFTSRMIRLTPAVRVSFGENKSRVYIKSGLCIGLGTKFRYMYTETSSFWGDFDKIVEKREFTGGISLGFHSGIGIYYSFFKNCGLFAEANAYLQNWAPKRSIMTEHTFNGVNQLPGMTTAEKEEEYLKEFTETSSSNENEPAKASKIYLPFSAVSLTLGFQMHFGGANLKPILDESK